MQAFRAALLLTVTQGPRFLATPVLTPRACQPSQALHPSSSQQRWGVHMHEVQGGSGLQHINDNWQVKIRPRPKAVTRGGRENSIPLFHSGRRDYGLKVGNFINQALKNTLWRTKLLPAFYCFLLSLYYRHYKCTYEGGKGLRASTSSGSRKDSKVQHASILK